MNYKVYCFNPAEASIELSDEDAGEYHDDYGRDYYVHPSFSAAKKHFIDLIRDSAHEWRMIARQAKVLKKRDIR